MKKRTPRKPAAPVWRPTAVALRLLVELLSQIAAQQNGTSHAPLPGGGEVPDSPTAEEDVPPSLPKTKPKSSRPKLSE